MENKILLFGPFGDFGGRELEVSFIASVLTSKYEVDICTTGSITNKSQVYDFDKKQNVFSIKSLLIQRFFTLRLIAFFSFLKNGCKGRVSDFVNNGFVKRFFDYDKNVQIVLKELVNDYDVIFICAQLSSGLVNNVVQIAKGNNKKVLFRTTGTIHPYQNYEYLNNVNLFIHHSESNACRLKIKQHNYVTIDQCAFNEIDLFKIPTSNKAISTFLILSRLSREKGITQVIDFFLRVCSEDDVLIIAGNGILENELKMKYVESNNILFKGFVNISNVSELFEEIDCLIIPSPEESGPLVGIEAMSAGKVILSTRVGAMEERLESTLNNFWFEYNNFESFKKVFFEVKNLNGIQVSENSISLKGKYKSNYSNGEISNKYIKIVDKVLNKCE